MIGASWTKTAGDVRRRNRQSANCTRFGCRAAATEIKIALGKESRRAARPGGCNTPGYAIFLADLNITMYAVGLGGAGDDFGRWLQRRRGLRRLVCAGLCRSMRQTHGFQESKRCADCADRTLLASSVMGEIIDL
jgi:hypothetical protein